MVGKLFTMLSLRPKTATLFLPSSLWETCSCESENPSNKHQSLQTPVLQRLWVREGKLFHRLQLAEKQQQREPL